MSKECPMCKCEMACDTEQDENLTVREVYTCFNCGYTEKGSEEPSELFVGGL